MASQNGLKPMIKPHHTPELQVLYNDMREAEEDLKFERKLQLLQEPTNGNGEHGDLEPPSPSPSQLSAPDMVRSVSGRSVTNSITGALGAVRIGNDRNRVQKKTGRARRSGPLEKDKKARAAFLRKLGACENCHVRKVRCTHYDLHQFEEQYKASKRVPSQPSLTTSYSTYSTSWPGPSTPFSAPSVIVGDFGQSVDHNLLVGIGTELALDPTRDPRCLLPENVDLDFENLLPRSSPLASVSAPVSPISPVSPVSPANLSPSSLRPPNLGYEPRTLGGNNRLNADPFMQNHFPVPRTDDTSIPIGRCNYVPGTSEEVWECHWNRDETESIHDSNVEVCSQNHWTIASLASHVHIDHVRIRKFYVMYRCKLCQALWYNGTDKCYQCPDTWDWEKWCYADIVNNPSVASAPTPVIRVNEYGGSFPKWQTGPGSMGNVSGYNYPTGGSGTDGFLGCLYGNGGFQFSLNENPAAEKIDDMTRDAPSNARESHVWKTILPCLVTTLLFCLAWSRSDTPSPIGPWLSPGRLIAECVAATVNHLSACGFFCIVAGLVGTWLFKHIRLRVLESREAPDLGRCKVMREFFGIEPVGEHAHAASASHHQRVFPRLRAPEADILPLAFAR